MKKNINVFKKIIVCLVAVATLFAFASCSANFYAGGETAGSSESESVSSSITDTSIKGLPSDVNFTIKYVESTAIEATSATEVLAKIRPSVLELYCIVGSSMSSGSGVIVSFTDTDADEKDDKALILTCHHVIESASKITAKSIYGKEYTAELIGADPVSDIALLWMESSEDNDFEGLSAAEMMCDSDKLLVGEDVFAIGNPLGYLGGTVTTGIVSALNRDVTVENRKMTLIQTDAAINSGNSGGGLFDKNTGALIGIVNAGYKSSAAQGLSFAIPCGTVKPIMDQLLEKGYVEGNYDFGVTFTAERFYTERWSTQTYVVIDSVDIYGTFYKGGMEEGDVILSVTIGDKSIDVSKYDNDTLTELESFLSAGTYNIGDKVTVDYMRYKKSTLGYEKATAEFEIAQYMYGIITE